MTETEISNVVPFRAPSPAAVVVLCPDEPFSAECWLCPWCRGPVQQHHCPDKECGWYDRRVDDVAAFARWCVGSAHGDDDPRAEAEYERVRTDPLVHAYWRDAWKGMRPLGELARWASSFVVILHETGFSSE